MRVYCLVHYPACSLEWCDALMFLSSKPTIEMAKKSHVVYLDDVRPEIHVTNSVHAKSKWYRLVGDNVDSERVTLSYVELEPGGHTDSHSHDNMEQAFYFTKGRGVMMVDKKEYSVGPGTAVHVPLNTMHSYRNTGRSSLFFLVIEPRPS
jgi:quercetin dioxygenase-like cupin family protein